MPFINFNFGGSFPPDGFGGDFNGDFPPPRPRPPRRPIGNAATRTLINLLVTLVVGLVWFYLELPAINPHTGDFYFFIFLLCATYCASAVFTTGFQGEGVGGYVRFVAKQCRIPFFTVLLLCAVIAGGMLSSWVVIRAGSYSALLPIQSGDFAAEVEEISYDQIPMLDANSAALLGNRRLGELADMVSQFEILPSYTQINYRGRPVRVTSLAYGDIFKWFNNRKNGLPAYIVIDMVTREAEVVRLSEGMKYTTAEHFGRNLYRYLRFHYPTMMFDAPVLELDENGVPWWVCSRIIKRIGLFGGVDIQGAVLVNSITGEHSYMEQVPEWVDRLYSAGIIVQQYDFYGRYHNGFLNSLLGQRDVTVTTEGYNYIAIADDVYMYTGVTSVTSDESNIGFILSNQRTKETRFYSIAGAKEYSAMDSAQSQIQQMRYTATFPLLLNIASQPTYFMALKGGDGLVKMYAMVNVQQYDIVSTGSTVADCENSYRQTLASRGIIDKTLASPIEAEPVDEYEAVGVITDIRSSVIGGDTHYYVKLSDVPGYLDFDAASVPTAVLLNVGDRIRYRCEAFAGDELISASGFEYDPAPATPTPTATDTAPEPVTDTAAPVQPDTATPAQ
ncbi:MAG: CvpA family protein [Oscillibacter sp.]|nr:CvpA family protein [Oscillibacter sp.]